METPGLGLFAIVLYVIATFRVANRRFSASLAGLNVKQQTVALAVAALALHALALYRTTVTGGGFNLGIFNTLSLVAWFIAATVVMLGCWRPLESLTVVILPLTALAIGLLLLFPTTRLLPLGSPLGLELHVVLSIMAYGLFAIAAIQAAYLGLADYKLRHHNPIMNFLPPLPTMENILFQLTGTAFVLLSISLVVGAFYIRDVHAQHLAHKIVLSILAWIVFAVPIWGHTQLGWHGQRTVKYIIGGFVLLALAFLGSKAVLELILQRV